MISIIHPSRSRPQKAHSRYKEWTDKCSGKYEYILSIDDNDPHKQEYIDLFYDDILMREQITVNHNRTMVDAVNRAAKLTTGDIIIVISDDFFCFDGWDLKIREAVGDKTNWVLKTFDGQQSWIVTLPIMDREFYKEVGHVYYPGYKHLFCDTELTHIADLTGRLIIRNDIVFPHINEYYRGTGGDDLNVRNQRSWRDGERLYRKRVKQQFGINKKLDIYALTRPEALGHLRWLNPRIRK